MPIYLWPDPASPSGKSILVRTINGIKGIAIDERCCCCNCDQLPNTLYAKIEHNVNVEGGGVATATTYFELTATQTPDGCACTLGTDIGLDKKAWHGIFTRAVWTFVVDHYELVNCNVHMVMNCNSLGVLDQIELTVGADFYFPDNTSSGYCDPSGAIPVDCPLEYPINIDPEVGDITDMWLSNAAWS